MLGPAITVKGQLVWYTGHPRFFVGKERFGRSFFELLDRPLTMALVGPSRSTPTCPRSCCGQGPEIVLVGKLIAPSQLVGVLQLLTTEKLGVITVAGDDHGQR